MFTQAWVHHKVHPDLPEECVDLAVGSVKVVGKLCLNPPIGDKLRCILRGKKVRWSSVYFFSSSFI